MIATRGLGAGAQDAAVKGIQEALIALARVANHTEIAGLSRCYTIDWCDNNSVNPGAATGELNNSTLAAIHHLLDMIRDYFPDQLSSSTKKILKATISGYMSYRESQGLAAGEESTAAITEQIPWLKDMASTIYNRIKATPSGVPTTGNKRDFLKTIQRGAMTSTPREAYDTSVKVPQVPQVPRPWYKNPLVIGGIAVVAVGTAGVIYFKRS